jgi:hypothetical protein
MLIQTVSALWLVAALSAPEPPQSTALGHIAAQPQPYRAAKARRHFISITFDKQFVQPYSFGKHPLSDLLGQPVDEVHLEAFQYRSRDQQTLVNVVEYGKRATAIGATVYPFGSSSGATLALRGSIETIPPIRLAFSGPAPAPVYELTNGRATDVAIGIDMSDRAPGWGLGAHAFILGGIGRIHTDQLDGTRYFGEGGGGVTSGPFGVDVSVKFSVNRFDTPVPHRIYMIPVSVRGTLTF